MEPYHCLQDAEKVDKSDKKNVLKTRSWRHSNPSFLKSTEMLDFLWFFPPSF